MDLQLVKKGLELTRKKKKWVLLLAAFGVTSYGAFRVYNLPSFVERRKRFWRLISALITIVEAASDSAEIFGIISRDIKDFLRSDSDEIPNSLKQILKLTQSKEFSNCVVGITAAFTRGVFRGYQVENSSDDGSSSGFYDRFMDKLFSESGSGFASVVIGSFARNLVLAFYVNEVSNEGSYSSGWVNGDVSVSNEGSMPRWLDVMCSSPFKDLIGDCIQKFVSTAVVIYLEKTMHINTYDEFFAGLTNPSHDKKVKDLLVSLCNGSIETLVKSSHHVLTSSSSNANVGHDVSDISRFVLTRSNSDVVSKTLCSVIDDGHNVITVKHNGHGQGGFFNVGERRKSSSNSWLSTMSSTLAVPTNRKLVLDLTGRITFETVRSFLEFLLDKVFSNVKRSVCVVNDAIFDSGIRVIRYVTAKSYVLASICISLCLHVLDTPRELMLA